MAKCYYNPKTMRAETEEITNEARAVFASQALKAMPGTDEWDEESNIVDLMANLLHLADQSGHDPGTVHDRAMAHFIAEAR